MTITLYIKLQLQHYIKIVTSLFFQVFLFNIHLTASSSARPKTHNELNKTPQNYYVGLQKRFFEPCFRG